MEFNGFSFGYSGCVSGELVFHTAMTGYPEQLTDPSFSGQILMLTYPLAGNYGVPSEDLLPCGISAKLESDRIHAAGLVVFDYCEDYSNWQAVKSLGQWLQEQKVPAIYGVDTRELTRILRDNGSMKAVIIPEGASEADCNGEVCPDCKDEACPDCNGEACPAKKVSCKEPITYPGEGKRVVLVDCGVRHSHIRSLLDRGLEIVRVPYDYDFSQLDYDGVFVSDGPGDPMLYDKTVNNIAAALKTDKPVFGIGLGYLLLGRAAGCRTVALARPHRSANQPVRKNGSNRAYITYQNAAYTIEPESVPSDWNVVFTNLNDSSVDGIRHNYKPFMGTQFNPEACRGLNENFTIVDEFVSKL